MRAGPHLAPSVPAKAGTQSVLTLLVGFAALGSRLRGSTRLLIVAFLLAVNAQPATAQDRLPSAPYAYQQLQDPAKEAQAKALMETLRCLVCQGQSIADSDAPLAGDMRHEVRSKLVAGESPDEIREWLVARYGNWVSYDPPFDGATALLWLGPLAFLAIGGWLAVGRLRGGKGEEEGGTA